MTAAFLKVFSVGILLGLRRLMGLSSASASFVREFSVHAGSQPRLTQQARFVPLPSFDFKTMEPIRTPPEFQWWKPEVSDPAQFELQVPHWSPDFEFQESQQAAQSGESATSWQATELTLDTERTLVLDSDPPAQDEFPEFFYD